MTRDGVVSIARGWLGLKASNGSHKKIIDVYNKQRPLPRGYRVRYTDAWCATFVSAVFLTAGMDDFPFECGCPQMIRGFQNRGKWVEDDSYHPKIGDVIFYDWQDNGAGDNTGTPDHVGIVAAVGADSMQIIEGNVSNMVGTRNIKYNARYIRGFGLPNYGDDTTEPDKSTEAPSEPETPAKNIDAIAREVIRGSWGNGSERRRRLTQAGYDAAAVQKRVNEILTGKTADKPTTPTKPTETPTETTNAEIDALARAVIRGEYGNGVARRAKLGSKYAAVQKRVNEILTGK
jgi:hypothetical protein